MGGCPRISGHLNVQCASTISGLCSLSAGVIEVFVSAHPIVLVGDAGTRVNKYQTNNKRVYCTPMRTWWKKGTHTNSTLGSRISGACLPAAQLQSLLIYCGVRLVVGVRKPWFTALLAAVNTRACWRGSVDKCRHAQSWGIRKASDI